MNELKIFENRDFGKIRSLMVNNEPFFVGNDIATVLGYKNTRDALSKHIDEEDKISDVAIYDGSQNRNMTIINESGLYSLILSSKLESAKKFKRWVTDEVLPSIRKTGGYIAGEKDMTEDELVLKAMTVLNKKVENLRSKNEQLTIENAQQKQMIGELKPKADYTDKILQNKGVVTITAIAKDYGMSGEKMNERLHELGVQYKQSEQWFLYSKYHNNGYTHSETIDLKHKDGTPFVRMNTKWTQKGRLFLYELLKKNGLVPVIER